MSKVVIDVFAPDLGFPGFMDPWIKLAETFNNAHPGYEVALRGMVFETFPLEVAQAVRDGHRPALAEYFFYTGQVARDCRAQDGSPLFTSVEKAIGGRTEILGEPVVTGDVLPAFREYYSHDGELTSMPSIATTSVIYANGDLLRRAGVSELPQTWAEVEEACKAVARLSDSPAYPITWANHGTFFQQALASQGGLLVNNDNGRSGRATVTNLASKEMLAWVGWWRKVHREGHYLHTGRVSDWAGSLRAFAQQRVAMRISSSNDVNYMLGVARKNGFRLEVGGFPHNGVVPYGGNAVAGTSLWLANGLDEATQDGALAFLQFLHNPRNVAEKHRTNSFIPVTQASFDLLEREGWFDAHPYHRVASDQISSYPSRAVDEHGNRPTGTPPSRGAVFGDFAGTQDAMTKAMRDVIAHGADPVERFTQANAEAQKLLEEYNAYAVETGFRNPEDSPGHGLSVEYYTDPEAGEGYVGADLDELVMLGRSNPVNGHQDSVSAA